MVPYVIGSDTFVKPFVLFVNTFVWMAKSKIIIQKRISYFDPSFEDKMLAYLYCAFEFSYQWRSFRVSQRSTLYTSKFLSGYKWKQRLETFEKKAFDGDNYLSVVIVVIIIDLRENPLKIKT